MAHNADTDTDTEGGYMVWLKVICTSCTLFIFSTPEYLMVQASPRDESANKRGRGVYNNILSLSLQSHLANKVYLPRRRVCTKHSKNSFLGDEMICSHIP